MPAKGLNEDPRFMYHRLQRALLGRCWMVTWDELGPIEMEWMDMQIAG